jgi:hypothetical protein
MKITQSKVEKGRSLELDIAKDLRDHKLDPWAKRMPRSGAIEGLRSDIYTELPIRIECKRQEKWKPEEYYQQAVDSARPTEIPVVVMMKNEGVPMTLLSWNDFLGFMEWAKLGGWLGELKFSKRRQVRN